MSALMGQQESVVQSRSQAMTFEQKGMVSEAEQIWYGIAQADPRDAEAFAHLGLLEARQEHYEAAIANYRQAMSIDQDLPGLQINLGLALFKAAQFPGAIRCFSYELNKHPGDPRLITLLGMAHYGLKDYLVAIPYLRRIAELDLKSAELRLTLAQSCLWSKQYECVLNVHKEILALNAESAEADMLAGEALDQMQDGARAEKELRAAAVANPNQPNVHFGLGYLFWLREAWPEATAEFQAELENNPQHIKARTYLADSWIRQNEFQKALTELEKLGTSFGANPLVAKDRGAIYVHDGRSEDALREFKIAIESDPSDAEPHRQMANLYRSMGQTAEAGIEDDQAKRFAQHKYPTLEEVIESIESPAP